MTLAARLAGPLFVQLFTTDEALAAQAFDTIKVCTLALLPLGLQYEVVDGFTALGLSLIHICTAASVFSQNDCMPISS